MASKLYTRIDIPSNKHPQFKLKPLDSGSEDIIQSPYQEPIQLWTCFDFLGAKRCFDWFNYHFLPHCLWTDPQTPSQPRKVDGRRVPKPVWEAGANIYIFANALIGTNATAILFVPRSGPSEVNLFYLFPSVQSFSDDPQGESLLVDDDYLVEYLNVSPDTLTFEDSYAFSEPQHANAYRLLESTHLEGFLWVLRKKWKNVPRIEDRPETARKTDLDKPDSNDEPIAKRPRPSQDTVLVPPPPPRPSRATISQTNTKPLRENRVKEPQPAMVQSSNVQRTNNSKKSYSSDVFRAIAYRSKASDRSLSGAWRKRRFETTVPPPPPMDLNIADLIRAPGKGTPKCAPFLVPRLKKISPTPSTESSSSTSPETVISIPLDPLQPDPWGDVDEENDEPKREKKSKQDIKVERKEQKTDDIKNEPTIPFRQNSEDSWNSMDSSINTDEEIALQIDIMEEEQKTRKRAKIILKQKEDYLNRRIQAFQAMGEASDFGTQAKVDAHKYARILEETRVHLPAAAASAAARSSDDEWFQGIGKQQIYAGRPVQEADQAYMRNDHLSPNWRPLRSGIREMPPPPPPGFEMDSCKAKASVLREIPPPPPGFEINKGRARTSMTTQPEPECDEAVVEDIDNGRRLEINVEDVEIISAAPPPSALIDEEGEAHVPDDFEYFSPKSDIETIIPWSDTEGPSR